MFTPTHEQALADYLRDIAAAKADSSSMAAMLIEQDSQLNALWGQIDYIIYIVQNGECIRTILGGEAEKELAEITDTDEVTVLLDDGTHTLQTGGVFSEQVEYAVKWIQKASAVIGGKEVAVEAKTESIASLQKQLGKEIEQEKRQAIQEQIDALESGIRLLYQGDAEGAGLYGLMRQAVLLAVERADTQTLYHTALTGQEKVEQRFAEAMGDLLRDGYWSNTSYAPGQERLLYLEACEVMAQLSRPSVTYSVTVQSLSGVSGYEQERFRCGMALRIWDEQLRLNDWAYVTKLVEYPKTPEKDSITITNDLTSIGGLSLDSVIARITGIAETLSQKKALYDRSQAISPDGTIPARRLEGMIDVLRTRLSAAVSNWYTDGDGNII